LKPNANTINFAYPIFKHKHCVQLIAVREEISYESATSMLDAQDPGTVADTKLMLSGDFSFSYEPDLEAVAKHKAVFETALATVINKNDAAKCPNNYDATLNACQ
jgi:hypothetical protein